MTAAAPRPAAAPAPLRIDIGELHLPGFTPAAGARLAESFRHALAEGMSGAPAPWVGQARERLVLPPLSPRAGEPPAQTGRRLARAIAVALRNPPQEEPPHG